MFCLIVLNSPCIEHRLHLHEFNPQSPAGAMQQLHANTMKPVARVPSVAPASPHNMHTTTPRRQSRNNERPTSESWYSISYLLLIFLSNIFQCSFGGRHREIRQGKDLGASRGIWRVFGEILPLQKSKEKQKNNTEKTIKTGKPSNMFDNDSLVQHIYLENGTPEGIVLWYTLVSIHEDSDTLKALLAHLECDIGQEPQTYDIPIKEDTSHTFAIYTSCKL